MASAAVSDDCSEVTLRFDDVPQIDLRLLSQTELHSLSLSSSSAPSTSSQGDSAVPIPKIDRSVFNESAGSRKQTYFRLRLAPRNSSRQESPESEPKPEENSHVISLLKDLFAPHGAELPDDGLEPIPEDDQGNLIPIDVEYPESSSSVLQAVPIDIVYKPEIKIPDIQLFNKKRGRSRKNDNSSASGILPTVGEIKPIAEVSEKVNVKVHVKEDKQLEQRLKIVDFNQFEEQLRRKTEGLRTEDEFSEFLSGLSGEWGSSRKKRKIVDSSSFGDVLPAGWKLMLTINNDGGRVSLRCSRYTGPDGQQGVSSYVLSPFGKDTTDSYSVPADDSSQLACKFTSGNTADPPPEIDQDHLQAGSTSAIPSSSNMVDPRNQEPPLISGSPRKMQMGNFKCHKCTMSFDEKDHLLHHLLSSHKRSRNTAARSGLPNPAAAIMRDEKYECQLCRKLFLEKNRFTSHFGNHIKEYVNRVEGSAETTYGPKRMSKLKEPIPVDHVSTAEPYNAKIGGERNWEFLTTTVNVGADSNTYDISTSYQATAPQDGPDTMVRNDEQVCNDLGKQKMISALPNGAVNTVHETSGIASRLREAAQVKPRDNTDSPSDQPTVFGMDTKGSLNVVSSVHNLTHETDLKHDVVPMGEKNHVINNENLVSSLFDSSMEDIDLDELDDGVEVGNDLLIPEVRDSCFVLGEGVVNDGKQRNEGSLVQIGDKKRIMNDSLTGTQTSTFRGPKKEPESESCLPPSSKQQMVLPDKEAVVAGTIEEHRSYNSWHVGKTIGFHQEPTTSWTDDTNSVQGRGRSFPVVHSLEKHARVDEENESGCSIPEVKNLWQQKVLDGTSLSAPPNTSVVGDIAGHFISNVQSMWQQKIPQSSSLSSSLMKDSSKEREDAVTRPVIPSLNHHLQDTEEHKKGHSTSKVANPWQQKVPESSSVSAHMKTSHHDAGLMDVSSGVTEPTKINHDSRQHSSVPNYGRSEKSSGVGLPFSPQHQQSFPIINTTPSVQAMEPSKDFRSFRGQSPSYQDYDKSIGNVTSYRNRDKQKHEEAASTWNSANSFAFDSSYSMHDANAAMRFVQERSAEPNAHLFARNAQTVAPDHRGDGRSARKTQTVAPDHRGNVVTARNAQTAAPDHRENVVSARNAPTGTPDHRGTVVSARNTPTVAPDHSGNVVSSRNAQTAAPDHSGNVVSSRNAQTAAPDHRENVVSARNTPTGIPDHRGTVVSARNTPTVAPNHHGNVVSARNTQTVAPDRPGNVVSARNAETVAPGHRGKAVFGGTAEEPGRNNEAMFGLFSTGVDQQTSGINYSMNMYYSGTMPSDRRGGNVGQTGNSDQMVGYYNQSKPRQEVMTQPTWRTEENTLQNGLNYASHPMTQQPDCFPSYNMPSDNKVQSGYYGSSNQKTGNSQSGGGGGARSGGGEYLEYNFLPVQSTTTTSHSRGSKITPPMNEQQIQQQQQQQQQQNYESNWLQKDALGLFPKDSSTSNNSSSSSRHQVTALCVFCGSQFNTDGDFDEESVGYMCLNCKAKFAAAGPLNFF